MGVLDDAFTDLDTQVSEQLSESATFSLLRGHSGGTFDVATGTETGGTSAASEAFRAIRISDMVEDIPGNSGGYTRVRVVVFGISKADLAAASWTGAPLENDILNDTTGGTTVKRRVTRVQEEVHRNRWRVTTWSAA